MGRNQNHAIAKDVKINEEAYEVYVNGMNTEINHINSMVLIYNTNNDWGRSGNPGVLARTFYNVGYLEFSDGWGYDTEEKEEKDFKLTAAHELGHTILESYGGVTYSWQHKGSSYLFPQDEKPVKGNEAFIDFFKKDNMKEYFGEYYPREGEIDLMKYYNYEMNVMDRRITVNMKEERSIAAEKDVLGLIWLTKIKLK